MRTRWIHLFVLGAVLTACSDHPYDPDAPAIDPNAPRIHISSPARGTFAGDVATLTVAGTVSDDAGVRGVVVNGVPAALSGDGSWTATVPVTAGTQLIHAVATDADGNTGKESRAVVVGALQPIGGAVPRAINVAISAQTFDALGHGMAGFLSSGQLQALIAPSNPVIDIDGGPDCLYALASITSTAVGPATTVALTPRSGELALDIELDQVAIGAHLGYAVACFEDTREVSAAASHISISGTLRAGAGAGGFDVALVDQRVKLTGFTIDLGVDPPDIFKRLHFEDALGPIIGVAIEKLVVPLVNRSLGALDDVNTVDVLGTAVDIKLAPAQISFDAGGAISELDATLRAHGDSGSPGYVRLASELPAMTGDRGFELAVADDAVNQLLASFWAAGGLDRGFDLATASYGTLGRLYDRVELSAKVPPFVAASDGKLTLTVGDLLATFKNGGAIATQVAINAKIDLTVVTGPDGAPRIDVGTSTTYVDVLDEGVDGANSLSNAQFEAVTSFALGRVLAVGSGSLGAIPLPSFGGVAVHDASVAEQTGYLVVGGNLR